MNDGQTGKEKTMAKMNVVLCCAGGFSTTMLMERIKKTIHDSQKLNDDDFKFKAIAADLLDQEVDHMDALIMGPQIAHKLESIKPLIEPRHIPYVIVDQETYGKMDGATVLKQLLIAKTKMDRACAAEGAGA